MLRWQFSWGVALLKGLLPASVAACVSLLAAKAAEYQSTGSVTWTPDESQLVVTLATALALQAWGTVKNYGKNHPDAWAWLTRLVDRVP